DRAGALQADDLALENGSLLTHPATTAGTIYGLQLGIAGTLRVDANSSIDVSAHGYLGGHSSDNGANEGRTLNNVAGSVRRCGGSYGGLGAFGNAEQFANDIYGDYRNPNELGSGGGSDSGPAGNGGGLLQITAGSVSIDGVIASDGGNGSRFAAGGSGGGIKMVTVSISGAGLIHANGGNGAEESGGGGGGRVALFYTSSAGNVLANAQALGGTGFGAGAPGTVYRKAAQSLGELTVRGRGRETPLPEGAFNEVLIVHQPAVSARSITVSE